MRYVLTAEYGQVIEGFHAAGEAMLRAKVARDWEEFALAAQEREEWAELAARCPKFVQDDDRSLLCASEQLKKNHVEESREHRAGITANGGQSVGDAWATAAPLSIVVTTTPKGLSTVPAGEGTGHG